MAISKFLNNGVSYIDKAAQYLADRGLTIQDVPVLPFLNKNLGLKDESGAPFFPEGWAYQIKLADGSLAENLWLMRVCNWPGEGVTLYQDDKPFKDRPKFLHVRSSKEVSGQFIYYCVPWPQVVNAPIVLLHEKISSAALTQALLGVPSIAISGCTGYASGGKLLPGFEELIKGLATNTQLIVCFDGDIYSNPDVMNAAAKLAGQVSELRPDITCRFPMVPDKHGWDDYIVSLPVDQRQEKVMDALVEEGIVVDGTLPPAAMVQKYGLTAKKTKDGAVKIEHTLANYQRMLRHPEWENLRLDFTEFYFYQADPLNRRLSYENICNEYQMWLERCVFRGAGSEIRRNLVFDAIKQEFQYRLDSVPLAVLANMAEVTEDQALDAVHQFIDNGLRVIGPMTREETVETLIRIARDMVALWSHNPKVDVQWILALIGPSGCGKSSFPRVMLDFLFQGEYHPFTTQLAKEGNRATINEYTLQCESSLVAVVDEYNPSERTAKEVELALFTLSTQRSTKVRRPYGRGADLAVRHSALMLTTVDKNKNYIRTAKGDGAERRYITLEVVGTIMGPDGKMTSNRAIIAETWPIILRYGYQLWRAGDRRQANEFSTKYQESYIDEATAVQKVGRYMAAEDMLSIMREFGKRQYREGTQDWRFSIPQIVTILYGDHNNVSRNEMAEIKNLITECGAVDIGKARVNVRGGEVMKDRVFKVSRWDDWVANLMARM